MQTKRKSMCLTSTGNNKSDLKSEFVIKLLFKVTPHTFKSPGSQIDLKVRKFRENLYAIFVIYV